MHEENTRKILLDWLTFSVPVATFCYAGEGEDQAFLNEQYTLFKVLDWLGIDRESGFVQKRGLYGYATGFYLGGIRICFGGSDTLMVDMSGEGCRLYETLNPDLEWLAFIQRASGFKGIHFSRLDVACDTFGQLDMSVLLRSALEGKYVSRWKLPPRVVMGREETIDFGSTKSLVMLRIYNKTLERQCKADVPDDQIPKGWVRCEFQFRNQAVDSFLREWMGSGDISAAYLGLMANQLRFVQSRPSKETNLKRLKVTKWWAAFLDNTEPIRLAYRGGLAYNLDSLNRYVFGQAGSSIRTWLEVHDWDVGLMIQAVEAKPFNERQSGLISTRLAVKQAKGG